MFYIEVFLKIILYKITFVEAKIILGNNYKGGFIVKIEVCGISENLAALLDIVGEEKFLEIARRYN